MWNLTQHTATSDQLEAGVVEMAPADKAVVISLLTFDTLPDRGEINGRAELLGLRLCKLADESGDRDVMIGGAPFFMGPLTERLQAYGLNVFFAFSARESVDETQADGSVRKVAVFRHKGFVEA